MGHCFGSFKYLYCGVFLISMEPATDTYRTIITASNEVIYKVKGSKFLGYCFPMLLEEDLVNYLGQLKKEHHQARHHCYAYQLGVEQIQYRIQDDGEPSGTAGLPIYGQIQSFEVTNILVVVVRYFGGTKLGVGGLIAAYKECARLALENCEIITKTINHTFELQYDYKDMNSVMRIIKELQIEILHQKASYNCQSLIAIRKNKVEEMLNALAPLYEVKIKPISS